jgi:predicted AlkP superfamily pyrophosphatase or phosphodiesterase
MFGPGTPSAAAALERIDADVARIVAAGRKAEPDLVVAIVSDHGFAPVRYDVNLLKPFADAGLLTLSPTTGKVLSWHAALWGGASAAVVLDHPEDPVLVAKVKTVLDALAADPALHIEKIIDRAEIERRGIGLEASFYIDFQLGYELGHNSAAPPTAPSLPHGTHGWFTDHPEMHSTFFLNGPGVPAGRALGQVDMRDIAPTLARLLNVALPTAQGKPLF